MKVFSESKNGIKKDVILLNNLFNGEYVKENVGGEIINIYQSDNNKYYVYVNPYGNIEKKWDSRVKYVMFMRTVGNGLVKVIGKAKIKNQVCLKGVFKKNEKNIDLDQEKYINANQIKYGGALISKLGSWSKYYITFEAEAIYKAKEDIYLSTEGKGKSNYNTYILKEIGKINNQSQKLYIEESDKNYFTLNNIIENDHIWESAPVQKIDITTINSAEKSFLSIIKKENDELVNSNLLAYLLENNNEFWEKFITEVIKLPVEALKDTYRKITRESIGNIDLLIELKNYTIVIENKIKSGISANKENGYSQLNKYEEIAKGYSEQKGINEILFFLLRPNYNNEDYSNYDRKGIYKEIKYSQIRDIIKNLDANSIYYNEFKRVVEKHSAEYDNEIFEIMNERFIDQIKVSK